MRFFKQSILIFSSLLAMAANASAQEEVKTDIYMDLGKIIIDTRDWEKVGYMPNAKEYVESLKTEGYDVNLMVNFVDKLKEETYENCEQKLDGLVKFIDGLWKEEVEFDWTPYSLLILPPKDAMRKPKPYMFVNSLINSCPNKVLFYTESEGEVKMSRFLGLAAWHSDPEGDQPLIPIEEIGTFVNENFRFSYPEGCEVLLPEQCTATQEQIQASIERVKNPEVPVDPISDDPVPETDSLWESHPVKPFQ